MPYFTLQFQPSGPQLDVFVAVSLPREQALIKAQIAIPQPILTKGLLDTGASQTCVDPDIIQRLGLQPTGVTSVLTPSTGAVPHQAKTYDVRLIIPAGAVSWQIPALAVIESSLKSQGIEVLVGRDVLSECLMVYDGKNKIFSLAF